MGEYDDMRKLVTDGSKKLIDATNLSDEALMSINRRRTTSTSMSSFGSPAPETPSSSRKRISPYPTPTSGNFANARSSSRPRTPANSTPRLKANPRDSRSRYGAGCDGDLENNHILHCGDPNGGGWSSEMLSVSHKLGSIWNCGATINSDGTMSPSHPASPMAAGKATQLSAFAVNACGAGSVVREGRNESAYERSSGRAERVP